MNESFNSLVRDELRKLTFGSPLASPLITALRLNKDKLIDLVSLCCTESELFIKNSDPARSIKFNLLCPL